jgi:Short C-terminal domain
MPPLLRAAARTAVVAGTATAVSGRVARRQQGRWAQQEQQQWEEQQQRMAAAAPPAAAPAAAAQEEDPTAKLKELGQLHESGILTDEEFAAAKAKTLGI